MPTDADPPVPSAELAGASHPTKLPTNSARSTPRPGSTRAAFAVPAVRRVWLASFVSSSGSWMQNIALGLYARELSDSASLVGILVFAQLSPVLLLAPLSGALADAVDRRLLLIGAHAIQGLFSVVLLWMAHAGSPAPLALTLVVLGTGVGNAFKLTVFPAILPDLAGRENLTGAVALTSMLVNGSRFVGPVVYAVVFPLAGSTGVFALSAATVVFPIAAFTRLRLPDPSTGDDRGMRRLLGGLSYARDHVAVGRILATLTLFSLFCLPIVGQFPTLMEESAGIESKSVIAVLFGAFGIGAFLASAATGSVLLHVDKRLLTRIALAGFGALLGVLSLLRGAAPVLPTVFGLGFAYFLTTTAMMTELQFRLVDQVRGRVLALWTMAFAGTVPFGVLAAGPIIDVLGPRYLLGMGVAVAFVLAWWCDLQRLDDPPLGLLATAD